MSSVQYLQTNAHIDTFSDFTKRKMVVVLGCVLRGMIASFLVCKCLALEKPMLNGAFRAVSERSFQELAIFLASPQPYGPPSRKKESISGRISCPFHPVFITLALFTFRMDFVCSGLCCTSA